MQVKIIKGSVRFRILIATIIPITTIFIALIPISYYYLKAGFDREIEQRLISIASISASLPNIEYAAELEEGDEDSRVYNFLVNRLRSIKKASSLKSIFIFDREYRLLVSSEGGRIGKTMSRLLLDREELQEVFGGGKSSSILFKGDDGLFYKNAYVPAIFGENNEVIAVMGVSASATYFETLNNIRNGLIFLIIVSLLLLISIIVAVSKGISGPIVSLIEHAKLIARGDMGNRLVTRTYGELEILVNTFEEMRERLASRDSEMQMMLSGIAHEIRNPLGGMQIIIDILSERFARDPEVLQLVAQINNELRYLNNVVSSFLKYSRRISISLQRVRPSQILNEVIDLFSREISEKEISILRDVSDIEINSDNDILKQIFINVLLNAIQAVDRGGRIEICFSEEGGRFKMVFRDNGRGIKEEMMKDVFRPFFTTKEKGTGLGLALVKKYLLSMNGDIKIKSEYGKGCEVSIYLPLS